MNIEEARERIQKAIKANATELNLSSDLDKEKLTSADLEMLLPEIKKIKSLKLLNLTANQIHDISALAKLEDLQTLGLGNNQISNISPLAELKKLSKLHLWYNQIHDLSALERMKNLEVLELTDNTTLEKKIPGEILENIDNPQRIINYWLSLTKGMTRPLNEAKVVIVGQGSVGKTTLIERIINDKYVIPDKTDGIDIRQWNVNVNDHNVQLNIWDFGGQEIMHATHQFFLTKRSLYLLALDCRLDKDENRLEYWLRKIESLGENSPVIIVGTKADQHQFDLAQRDLKAKFPNIAGFYGVSAKTGEGIEQLSSAITEEIGQLDGVHNLLPESWFEVRTELEKLDLDYVSFGEYCRICQRKEVNRENEETDLVDLLHDLGIVLCFHKDSRLQDTNVLQPEWVTKGVYKILNARSVFENNGKLTVAMLPAILDRQKYPPHKYRFILDMMRKFELCYEIAEDQFLIPDLLRNEEPDTGDWDDALRFQYQYEVFFSSLISRFIVRMHDRIFDKLLWRNGVVLAYKSGGRITNQALIKADTTAARISIAVTGEPNTRRDFLSLIRGIFEGIHDTFPNLAVKEKVPIPGHEEIVADYNHLIALEAKGVDEHYPEGLTEPVSIKAILNGIETKTDQQVDAMSEAQIEQITRAVGGLMAEMGDYFDKKLDRNQSELLEFLEILNTAKSSGPKGKVKLFIPFINKLGLEVSKEYSPEEVKAKLKALIFGEDLTKLNLPETREPKKLKD